MADYNIYYKKQLMESHKVVPNWRDELTISDSDFREQSKNRIEYYRDCQKNVYENNSTLWLWPYVKRRRDDMFAMGRRRKGAERAKIIQETGCPIEWMYDFLLEHYTKTDIEQIKVSNIAQETLRRLCATEKSRNKTLEGELKDALEWTKQPAKEQRFRSFREPKGWFSEFVRAVYPGASETDMTKDGLQWARAMQLRNDEKTRDQVAIWVTRYATRKKEEELGKGQATLLFHENRIEMLKQDPNMIFNPAFVSLWLAEYMQSKLGVDVYEMLRTPEARNWASERLHL